MSRYLAILDTTGFQIYAKGDSEEQAKRRAFDRWKAEFIDNREKDAHPRWTSVEEHLYLYEGIDPDKNPVTQEQVEDYYGINVINFKGGYTHLD